MQFSASFLVYDNQRHVLRSQIHATHVVNGKAGEVARSGVQAAFMQSRLRTMLSSSASAVASAKPFSGTKLEWQNLAKALRGKSFCQCSCPKLLPRCFDSHLAPPPSLTPFDLSCSVVSCEIGEAEALSADGVGEDRLHRALQGGHTLRGAAPLDRGTAALRAA